MLDKYNKNETKTTVNILIQIKPQGKKTIIIFYYFIFFIKITVDLLFTAASS